MPVVSQYVRPRLATPGPWLIVAALVAFLVIERMGFRKGYSSHQRALSEKYRPDTAHRNVVTGEDRVDRNFHRGFARPSGVSWSCLWVMG
jgi:hypothetical protein